MRQRIDWDAGLWTSQRLQPLKRPGFVGMKFMIEFNMVTQSSLPQRGPPAPWGSIAVPAVCCIRATQLGGGPAVSG
jgi:hypothetical protein